MPTVTVLIVSYNTRTLLKQCLESIPAASRTQETAVIVVDNASSDGSADLVANDFPHVELVRNAKNVGFARAVNQGAERITSDFILLLNPDGHLQANAVDNLVRFADAHPEYVICGGRTLDPVGRLDPRSCWAAPSLWSVFCNAFMLSVLFPKSQLVSPEVMPRFKRDRVREVDIVTGCLLLIRRSDWNALGGFDERFFVYGEDAELCLRASTGGRRCAITPDAVMVHVGGKSAETNPHHHALVLAGQITLMAVRWPSAKARIGRALVLAGVFIRTRIGAFSRREAAAVWQDVWKRRRVWQNGYPLEMGTTPP